VTALVVEGTLFFIYFQLASEMISGGKSLGHFKLPLNLHAKNEFHFDFFFLFAIHLAISMPLGVFS
jgi:hypothetical protein